MVGIVVFVAAAVSSLIWFSVSLLTKQWRGRTLFILWTSCAVLSGLFWLAVFAMNSGGVGLVSIGLLIMFLSGFLFALAVEMNTTYRGGPPVFRFASAVVLLTLIGGGSMLIAKSVPEKRLPILGAGPLWTFDIASTGCRPAWGGPDSSAAAMKLRSPLTKHWA